MENLEKQYVAKMYKNVQIVRRYSQSLKYY